jgi:hypothetical protein
MQSRLMDWIGTASARSDSCLGKGGMAAVFLGEREGGDFRHSWR